MPKSLFIVLGNTWSTNPNGLQHFKHLTLIQLKFSINKCFKFVAVWLKKYGFLFSFTTFFEFLLGGEKHVIAGAKVWPFLQSKRPESRFYQLLAQKIASTLIFISSTTCPHFWKTIFSHQIILVEMQKAKRWQQCEKAKEERRKVERKVGLQRKGDFWNPEEETTAG